jgi:hypothetical protein
MGMEDIVCTGCVTAYRFALRLLLVGSVTASAAEKISLLRQKKES